ncbi:unnamed protein product, partial [Rotaria sordida]
VMFCAGAGHIQENNLKRIQKACDADAIRTLFKSLSAQSQ